MQFGLILSGLMSCIVSGIATYRVLEAGAPLLSPWMNSRMFSWLVACSTVLVVAPMTRRIVARLVRKG